MKGYGGKRMCDIFSLNYSRPHYSIVKKDYKKEVQFIPVEHSEIFVLVAEIYKKAKV